MAPDSLTVTREINELERKVYQFWFYDHRYTLYLDSYQYQVRASKRHKWRVKEKYHRLAGHHETWDQVEPQLPDDVAAEARRKFAEAIKVEIWPEEKKRRW